MIDHTRIKGDKEVTASETLGSRRNFFHVDVLFVSAIDV